jgi:hypothetical protein
MVLVELQENLIKADYIIKRFEGDFLYKANKVIGGKEAFEEDIRQILNLTIKTRNQVIVKIEEIGQASQNKDVIELIETGYFNKIANALTQQSLVRVINSTSISIPNTAMNIIGQNQQIISIINEIALLIDDYNKQISTLRQSRNRIIIVLYYLPSMKDLPNIINAQINLENLLILPTNQQNLLSNQVNSISSNNSIPTNKPITPVQQTKNVPSNNNNNNGGINTQNISSKF